MKFCVFFLPHSSSDLCLCQLKQMKKNQAYQIDAFTNADQLSQTGHQNGLGLYSDLNQGATGRVPQANVRSFFVVLSPLFTATTATYTHKILDIAPYCLFKKSHVKMILYFTCPFLKTIRISTKPIV